MAKATTEHQEPRIEAGAFRRFVVTPLVVLLTLLLCVAVVGSIVLASLVLYQSLKRDRDRSIVVLPAEEVDAQVGTMEEARTALDSASIHLRATSLELRNMAEKLRGER